MGEIIRTAIATAALLTTLGGGILGGFLSLKGDVQAMQNTVSNLTVSVQELRCDISPADWRCTHGR